MVGELFQTQQKGGERVVSRRDQPLARDTRPVACKCTDSANGDKSNAQAAL
jgi:hypothetical protein